jgi:hypothetical protein
LPTGYIILATFFLLLKPSMQLLLANSEYITVDLVYTDGYKPKVCVRSSFSDADHTG